MYPAWWLKSGSFSVLLVFLVWFPFAAELVQAAETNSTPRRPESTATPPKPTPQETAAAYERVGRKAEAAALYEAMARTNPVARKALSHRLVMIYAETGETNKALTWAREVMRDNPDPQAYLAGVHARLGNWTVAERILEKEIAANTNVTRAVTLRWQLAEAYEKEGNRAKASKVLNEAAGLARGTSMEATTQRRLKAVQGVTK